MLLALMEALQLVSHLLQELLCVVDALPAPRVLEGVAAPWRAGGGSSEVL